jgi:hypothetical protein
LIRQGHALQAAIVVKVDWESALMSDMAIERSEDPTEWLDDLRS